MVKTFHPSDVHGDMFIPAPVCHMHADDTSIHVASRQSAAAALDQGVGLFCTASGPKLNRAKTQGLLLGAAADFQDEGTGLIIWGRDV